MTDPQLFDRFAERYAAAAEIERDYSFFLENLPPRNDRALEVGCGSGQLARALAPHFTSVLAVDLSEPMLELARKKQNPPNVVFQHADANNLNLVGQFDAIVSHTTFHHVENLVEAISALKSVLRPGGRLLLIDGIASRYTWVPRNRLTYRGYITLRFPLDCLRWGSRKAWTIFRFKTSEEWVSHVISDRYFGADEFERFYRRLLPGAFVRRVGPFMGLTWDQPTGSSKSENVTNPV